VKSGRLNAFCERDKSNRHDGGVSVKQELWGSQVVSQFDQRNALCWDLATMSAIEYAPQGEVLGNVLKLMLNPRSYE